jgi:heptosyltransferase-2
MVLAQSLFKALYRVSDTVIDVLAPAPFGPLLSRMPEVGDHIEPPFRRGKLDLGVRYHLGRDLSGRGYDQAIILPNSWKSALTPFWARIPMRTGYVGEQRWGLVNDIRKLVKSKLPMTVQRFAALAGPESAADIDIDPIRPRLDSRPQAQQSTAGQFGVIISDQPVLVLCPGAQYGPAKRWPAEYFAQIASSRLDRGWQVCILGSSADAAIADEINGRCGHGCIDLTARTSIDQAVDIMGLATVIVSNDSGLIHVAAALEKPLVAIFGSTDPAHTPPLSTNCKIEYLGLACSPCFKRECPLHHLNCLTGLTPDGILRAMDEVAG